MATPFTYLFRYLISFHAFVYMTQQMSLLVAAPRPVVTRLRPYTLGLIGFQAVLLLLQQNLKYTVFHILPYMPRLDIVVIPFIGKYSRISAISMDH
jgi:hypothetical protein